MPTRNVVSSDDDECSPKPPPNKKVKTNPSQKDRGAHPAMSRLASETRPRTASAKQAALSNILFSLLYIFGAS
jgi:hypothetical protein